MAARWESPPPLREEEMGPPPGQCWVSRTWAGGSEEARHRPRCLRRQDEPSLGPGAGEAPTLPPGLWRSALPPSCVYLPATPQLCSAGPVPEPSSTRTPTKIAKILGFWVCWDTIRQLLRQFLCQNKTFSPEKFLQSATPPQRMRFPRMRPRCKNPKPHPYSATPFGRFGVTFGKRWESDKNENLKIAENFNFSCKK